MAELLAEKWLKGVAVTTTVLAVCASVSGSRGTTCMAKTQLLTSQQANEWAYYQAKSIKQNLLEAQKTNFEIQTVVAQSPEQRALLQQQIDGAAADIRRYEEEKIQIKAQADKYTEENEKVAKQATQYSLSVVFLQIGIMLSSVSALLKRRWMWIVGMIIGVVGMVFLANGFLLFFTLPAFMSF